MGIPLVEIIISPGHPTPPSKDEVEYADEAARNNLYASEKYARIAEDPHDEEEINFSLIVDEILELGKELDSDELEDLKAIIRDKLNWSDDFLNEF